MHLQNCFSLHYTCILTEKPENPTEKPEKPTEKPEKTTPNQRNSSMETQALKIMPFLIAILGLTLHLI